MTVNVNEITLDPQDPTKTSWGTPLDQQLHFAWATGTAGADSFDANTDVSSATRSLMDQNQRGVSVDLGAGDDAAVGSSYGDNFDMGSGTNYVDGGANLGTPPWGGPARDILMIFVADQAGADAVTVSALDANSTGTDGSAFASGYTFKVVSGAETTYAKNVEAVNVSIWNDANGDGQKDWGAGEVSFARYIPLTLNVNEVQVSQTDGTQTAWGTPLADQFQMAWANGTVGADTFNAATDVSSATQSLMDTYQRGVYADLGAGNDTAVGSSYGDDFVMGSGTNYVDGGANLGTAPWGGKAVDSVDIFVADQAAANAVSVTALDASATGTDGTAFAGGYTYKVVSGAETTYVKNVEAVNVSIWNDANGNGQKDWGNGEVSFARYIPLTLNVNEVQVSQTDGTQTAWGTPLADQFQMAWANGTAGADTFNAATDVSSATQSLMNTYQRGVYADLGAGNDTAVGSSYGDDFVMGSGTNYVDGGANLGTAPWGGKAVDSVDIFVADQAAANAVSVTALDASSTGTDAAAFGNGYAFKVTSGTETTYVKNVEQVNVSIWNDANGNGQKDWGAGEVTYARNINLAVNVGEVQVSQTDGTKTAWGTPLADQFQMAWANGTAGADTFNAATDVSSATQSLMNTYQRGVYVELGAGNDTAVGSDYGDDFTMGAGVNYVDGGANLGTAPWGGKAVDSVDIFVADQAAANAVTVTALDASSTGTDGTAFAGGYTYKVVSGAETTYVKNVEQVNVSIWNDANGNGQKDWGAGEVTYARNIPLTLTVNEIQVSQADPTKTAGGTPLTDQYHFAWANGTAGADSFNAATDISSATRALMDQYQHGVNVELGAGDDTAVGSSYADNFAMGAGTNWVDGGANLGTPPWGGKAADALDIFVADQAAANAVSVTALDASSTGTDGTAFAGGYTYKVVSGAETTYVKNVEQVNVSIWNDANGNGQKDWGAGEVTYARNIPLTVVVNEVQLDPADSTRTVSGDSVAGLYSLAWANGAPGADTFNASTDVSSATQALMDQYQRGVYVDLGAGDDTAVGSGYGDDFTMGAGTNHVDGGANAGTAPWGGKAVDSLDIFVSDQAAANAVSVTALDASSTGADATAFAGGYAFKVVAGDETTYTKDVEQVNVSIWNDANGNGQRDWNAGEVTFAHNIPLAVIVNEVQVSPTDSSRTVAGDLLSTQFDFAWANGSVGNDVFHAATDVSSATQALMAQYGRGVWVDLGSGNDVAVGSDYGDDFTMGAGVNRADGGANAGTDPNGHAAIDSIEVFVADGAGANAVAVTGLDASATGEDATAFSQGYTVKVVSGAETTYAKNMEQVNVQIWTDLNGNGQRDPGEMAYARGIQLVPTVFENSGDATALANSFQIGSVNGTPMNDTIDLGAASTLIPAQLASDMATYRHGLYVNTGAGNDTVLGTGYGDYIDAGSGVNHVDAGANAGVNPGTINPARDTLEVIVGTTAQAQAVTVTELTGSLSGADLDAANSGYRFKVQSTATNETDYVANVESVSIRVWTDANGDGVMDQSEIANYATRALGVTMSDNVPSATNQTPALGFMFGTQFADTLDGNSMLAALGKTFDPSHPYGAFMFGIGGNDVIKGTDGTDFAMVTQNGSHLIDGGADAGYYAFTAGAPAGSSDQYRLVEQGSGPLGSAIDLSKYRLVDLTKWSSYQTDSLDHLTSAATTDLSNLITKSAISAADADSIAAKAAQVGLTAVGADGYQFAVVKYDASGTLLGVDFLKNVENAQFGLWVDTNRNDIPNGGGGETSPLTTFAIEQDSYVLAQSDASWLSLTFGGAARQFAGLLLGTSGADTIDASAVAVPGYFAAGTGFRIGDAGGSDTVIGSAGNDLFGLGAGNDVVNGNGGNDVAAVFWKPDATKGNVSLSESAVNVNGITTITVSQTTAADGVTTALLTLVNDGTDGNWTMQTTGTAADAFIRPNGITSAGVGTDQLLNVGELALYLQSSVAVDTGGVTTSTPFEIQLVGVPA